MQPMEKMKLQTRSVDTAATLRYLAQFRHLGRVLFGLAFVACLGLSGCAATAEPTPVVMTPQATATATLTPMPSPTTFSTPTSTRTDTPTTTPSPTPTPPNSPLAEFPLDVGNTWVYTSIRYAGYDTQTITMTATMTNTVVEVRWQPPIFAAKIRSEYKPDQVPGDLEENEWVERLPLEESTDSYWYVISGTQVYLYYTRNDMELKYIDWKSALSQTGPEYVFPLAEGDCWEPHSAEPVDAAICWQQASAREVIERLEPSQPTNSLGTHVLTITYSTRTLTDEYKDVEAQIELDDCATDCSECFLLVTWDNPGAYREWLCPGIGVVGGFWHHQGTPFGEAAYLVDYTLHDRPTPVATPAAEYKCENTDQMCLLVHDTDSHLCDNDGVSQ